VLIGEGEVWGLRPLSQHARSPPIEEWRGECTPGRGSG
jgi:hypothetical protein